MTHTKGPWEVRRCSEEIGMPLEVVAPSRHVAKIYEHSHVEANARLIAAAPALYEALKAMYAVWGYKSDGHTPELSDQVEAALALVEGKP